MENVNNYVAEFKQTRSTLLLFPHLLFPHTSNPFRSVAAQISKLQHQFEIATARQAEAERKLLDASMEAGKKLQALKESQQRQAEAEQQMRDVADVVNCSERSVTLLQREVSLLLPV